MKKAALIALIYILGVSLFLACGAILVMFAAGYRIDYQGKNIAVTSIIEVSAQPNTAGIYINDELQGQGRVVLRNLNAGFYNIEVKDDGYHEWNNRINLASGEAKVIETVLLFKTNPKINNSEPGVTVENIINLADTNGLGSNGGEIYYNNDLVTRFSDNVRGLCWYPDRRHIVFTQNDKLKIVDLDGTNEIELLAKNSSTPVIFSNSGHRVIYENNGKIFQADIR